MKNIYSNIFKVNNNNLSKAINHLKEKELVGVPTETVYGLAANAYSDSAVQKIFTLKKRPKSNPLIIHFNNLKNLKNDVIKCSNTVIICHKRIWIQEEHTQYWKKKNSAPSKQMKLINYIVLIIT